MPLQLFFSRFDRALADQESLSRFRCPVGVRVFTKAVMFPVSIVFFIVLSLAARGTHGWRRRTGEAVLAFTIVSAPFMVAISIAKHRPTFGDSGRRTYQIEVQRDDWFVSRLDVTHPVPALNTEPKSYYFARPISGTYPLWYDPSYWHDGSKTTFELRRQFDAIVWGVEGLLEHLPPATIPAEFRGQPRSCWYRAILDVPKEGCFTPGPFYCR